MPVPSSSPTSAPQPHWDYLIGSLLVLGAGALIIATIGEDIATAGVGTADDAPSFAAAAAMFTTGMALVKSVPGQQPIITERAGI